MTGLDNVGGLVLQSTSPLLILPRTRLDYGSWISCAHSIVRLGTERIATKSRKTCLTFSLIYESE